MLIPSLSSLSPPPAGKGIIAEQTAAEQSASWPLRRRLTSDSLAVGKYVECLEDKFRETLDAEVSPRAGMLFFNCSASDGKVSFSFFCLGL